jgi:hypothetical protein
MFKNLIKNISIFETIIQSESESEMLNLSEMQVLLIINRAVNSLFGELDGISAKLLNYNSKSQKLILQTNEKYNLYMYFL